MTIRADINRHNDSVGEQKRATSWREDLGTQDNIGTGVQ